MSIELLDNIAWHSLTGHHRAFAQGTGPVRRYRRGFTPVAAFERPQAADGQALAALFEAGETALLADIEPLEPRWRAWAFVSEQRFRQMVMGPARRVEVPAGLPVRRLGPADLPTMRRLIARTAPGPFGERSHELGDFAGVFDGEELIALAGSRPRARGLREIGTVCTAPEHRGRGHASQLVRRLAAAAWAGGELPFLHVAESNLAAQRIYRRIGFSVRRDVTLRALRRLGPDGASAP